MKKVILLVISIVVLIIFLISQNWKIGERELGVVKMSQERIDEKIKAAACKGYTLAGGILLYLLSFCLISTRLILPLMVLGSSSTNSTRRPAFWPNCKDHEAGFRLSLHHLRAGVPLRTGAVYLPPLRGKGHPGHRL